VIMAYSHYECTETIASFAFKRVNSMGCEWCLHENYM
jgi:hypothetical protein